MKINTSILYNDNTSAQERAKRAKKPTTGYGPAGFTPEQADRGKKHEGTGAQRIFVKNVMKLKMMGYDNTMLSMMLLHMPTEEIKDMRLWRDLLGFLRSGMDPEKAYWARKAGFTSTELEAVERMSTDSLKMMVKVGKI